jgi:ketosteroid isomerase-like protein
MWLTAFDELLSTDAAGPALDDSVRIDDPQHGHVDGATAIAAYRDASDAWLRDRSAVVHGIATTTADRRIVGEFGVELTQDGRSFTLPVAVMIDTTGGPDRTWIRVYHSQWPLLGHHVRRPPLLERDPGVRESDVVGRYQAALADGDAERILATFEPDGCFREPAGGDYRVCGTDALRELFTHFFGSGGITLEHCTATEDGVRTALEFNAVRWGGTDMPHQAGIAVYERGRTGRIAEARIYDDVDPPLA